MKEQESHEVEIIAQHPPTRSDRIFNEEFQYFKGLEAFQGTDWWTNKLWFWQNYLVKLEICVWEEHLIKDSSSSRCWFQVSSIVFFERICSPHFGEDSHFNLYDQPPSTI